jgi:thiamine-phosphate pyrophosphorylase
MPDRASAPEREDAAIDRRFLLCLVTDRRRLCRAAERPPGDAESLLLDQIRGAATAGVDLVQLREPDLEGAALASLGRRALEAAAGSATRVLINDRIDVALAVGAHGVHLRESSVMPQKARRLLGDDATIGRSVHAAEDAAAAREIDYVIAGTVFPTESKPQASLLGVEGLQRVVQAVPHIPVLAIGGVAIERVRSILDAGAAGLAAIGAFIPPPGSRDIAAFVAEAALRLRACAR